mgnify:CR=1 FL=1
MKFVTVYLHLLILRIGSFSKSVLEEIYAIPSGRIEMPFDPVEVPKSKSVITFSVVGSSLVIFIPHCLHFVAVRFSIVILSREHVKQLICFGNIVGSEYVFGTQRIQIFVS